MVRLRLPSNKRCEYVQAAGLPKLEDYQHAACAKVCGRNLPCGHACVAVCHEGGAGGGGKTDCPPCSKVSSQAPRAELRELPLVD